MSKWNQLTRHEQEVLAGKYGITCTGNMQPVHEVELEKVPAHEWDRLLQKEAPVRKVKAVVEVKAEVKEPKKLGIAKKVVKEVKKTKKKK